MNLAKQGRIFFPQGSHTDLINTTHLAIAAHQDDVEIMAQHGILACFGKKDKNFSAVIVTDGAGSPRAGLYKNYTDEEMKDIRIKEQKKAAMIGDYYSLILLGFPSKTVRDPKDRVVVERLKEVLLETKPSVIYTHNPADRHKTHIATSIRVIRALQELASVYKPDLLLGCEVWRALDWLDASDKKVLDVSDRPALRSALLGVFDSQIEGGKRYDLAGPGRCISNATFSDPNSVDTMDAAVYAMDLTPLIEGGDVAEYIKAYLERFADNVIEGIKCLT